jgi:lysophospholipase L1-like esterase
MIFSLIPVVFICLLGELGLRTVYYQNHSHYPIALIHGFQRIQQRIWARIAEKKIRTAIRELGFKENIDIEKVQPLIVSALYSEEGTEVRVYLENKYESAFKLFTEEVAEIGSRLLLLFLPYSNPNSEISNLSRNFFRNLADQYSIDFIDPSPQFVQYPGDWRTLYPEDSHLSRFGNQLLVELVMKYIAKYSNHRITTHFQKRPALFGVLKPNSYSVWEMKRQMPFRVITNKQGLRMDYDITFPKTKQRVLALGDSGTFGPFLDNHDTYPTLLDRKYPDKEVINAGMYGYTITDELKLFVEKAKYLEPDIVILQVYGNDLSDLFFYNRDLQGRSQDDVVLPSAVELRFLEMLISQRLNKRK